jgi:hypothetical protein
MTRFVSNNPMTCCSANDFYARSLLLISGTVFRLLAWQKTGRTSPLTDKLTNVAERI